MKKRITSEITRTVVLDRAINADGHIECSHCHTPIEVNHVVTMQHIVPFNEMNWNSYDAIFSSFDPSEEELKRFKALIPQAQKDALIARLNRPDNVYPLHVSCHKEEDEAAVISAEQAREMNLDRSVRASAEAQARMLADRLHHISTPTNIRHVFLPTLLRAKSILQERLGKSTSQIDVKHLANKIGLVDAMLQERAAVVANWPIRSVRTNQMNANLKKTPLLVEECESALTTEELVKESMQLAELVQTGSPYNIKSTIRKADIRVLQACEYLLRDELAPSASVPNNTVTEAESKGSIPVPTKNLNLVRRIIHERLVEASVAVRS